MRVFFPSLLLVTAALGCSSAAEYPLGPPLPGGTGGAGGAASTASSGLGFGSVGSSGGPTCTKAAELVYVVGGDSSFWSFDPPSTTFTKLFTLHCDTPKDGNQWSANSMAIDRSAVAWVNFVGYDPSSGNPVAGVVFKVDIATGACAPTPAVTLTTPNFYQLGMGFSADMPGGASETLFVDGIANGGSGAVGLAALDTTSGTLTPIGNFANDANLTSQSAELTGTGSAQLFGYFTTTPYVRVAQIDKATANVLSDDQLAGVPPPDAWAFSFWGGAFYLYAAYGSANSSVVYFDPATKTVNMAYVPDTGSVIVGAGVSTCAPVTPPP